MNGRMVHLGPLEAIYLIREIQLLLSNLQEFDITYARRDTNEVAHTCARKALVSGLSVESFDVLPSFIFTPHISFGQSQAL
jgi:hypothetical protein